MALFGIKIKPLKWLGKAVQIAGPVAVAVLVSPAAGAVAAAATGGTAVVKKLGQAAGGLGLGRPHKVAGPVAAVGLPTAFAALAGAMGADNPLGDLTGLLGQLEAAGVPPWLAIGLWLWFTHQSGNNVENSGNESDS